MWHATPPLMVRGIFLKRVGVHADMDVLWPQMAAVALTAWGEVLITLAT